MTIIVPLRIIDLNNDGFHPLIDINLYGKDFTVVLDTGASKTALDKVLLQAHEEVVIVNSDKLSTGLGTNEMVRLLLLFPTYT